MSGEQFSFGTSLADCEPSSLGEQNGIRNYQRRRCALSRRSVRNVDIVAIAILMASLEPVFRHKAPDERICLFAESPRVSPSSYYPRHACQKSGIAATMAAFSSYLQWFLPSICATCQQDSRNTVNGNNTGITQPITALNVSLQTVQIIFRKIQ